MFYKIIYVVEINSEKMHLYANMYANVCVLFGMGNDDMYQNQSTNMSMHIFLCYREP